MKRYSFILPTFLFLFLIAILAYELFYAKAKIAPPTLVGRDLPHFEVQALNDGETLTEKDLLKQNKVVLLNFWATWCDACVAEHEMLMKIQQTYHIPIFSLLYKDQASVAERFLAAFGNPFEKVGIDHRGDVAIEFGIYGTPETYLISSKGHILYRHIGVIDEETWENTLYPLIKKNSVNNV